MVLANSNHQRGHSRKPSNDHMKNATRESENEEQEDDQEDEEEDESEDEEPRLKYVSLTKSQGSLYRGGDSVSAFLVTGDKMVVGTHEGVVHILSLPSLRSLRVYQAHKRASVTAISISPFISPRSAARPDGIARAKTEESNRTPSSSISARNLPSSQAKRQEQTNAEIPSSFIHVATCSIDGNVCIASLADPKDILMRSFGRPVQAVALSPEFKKDRLYLSGGKAGNLILTIGGRSGTSAASSTIGGAAAATTGWLENIGLSTSNGVDTVLHRGEGEISTIKWSRNGRYVVWINEKGIKIMRSHLHLQSGEADLAWKRMTHIDPPDIPGWEDMARLWRARAEWIDENGLESDDQFNISTNGNDDAESISSKQILSGQTKEHLLVGWGGNVWIINVHPSSTETRNAAGEGKLGRVELVTFLRTDCIISGISLYTPNLLLILAYVLPEEKDGRESTLTDGSLRKGVHRRQNALKPEIRMIDIISKEEVYTDTLNLCRYEGLSTTDYHLGVLPIRSTSGPAVPRGTFEAIGGGIWDATMYPKRLFDTAISVRSGESMADRNQPQSDAGETSSSGLSTELPRKASGPNPALFHRGMRFFIQSPYDCVLATRSSISDHLAWLESHEKYEEAWNLLDAHPEASTNDSNSSPSSTPTKSKQGSLEDFFGSVTSQSTVKANNFYSQGEKDKRRIGEKWMEQLVQAKQWQQAGKISALVLGTSSRWEHWTWTFAEAKQFDAITPFVPVTPLRPPISPTIYEMILGHYLSIDRERFKEILETLSPVLYEVGSIITAVEEKVRSGEFDQRISGNGDVSQDWRILRECLAKLYLANGRAKDALRCYIDLKDADEAMRLIGEYHLVDALSDDISGLLLLRVSKDRSNISLPELEEASQEAIRLLAAEALNGVVRSETVISQLEAKQDMRPFLFFYLRALWNGNAMVLPVVPKFSSTKDQLANEGHSLVNDSADLAVQLFSEYDRGLFFDFLKSSQSYDLASASTICENRQYIPELVHLLAKEGRTKRALCVIIEKLGDASVAISFAKEQNDPDLWNDLLDYSMNKPSFIRALLHEVGTAINPATLVRRIPEGLEIEGLRDALSRLLKEYELQCSISKGVARVFRGEVADGMARLQIGQRKGTKFNVRSRKEEIQSKSKREAHVASGCCSICSLAFQEDEKRTIVGFPCTHNFHVDCLIKSKNSDANSDEEPPQLEDVVSPDTTSTREFGIGLKIQHAKLLQADLGTGCPLERGTE